jgi:hypothetical protein
MAFQHTFTADLEETPAFSGPGYSFAVYSTGTPVDCTLSILRLSAVTGLYEPIDDLPVRAGVQWITETRLSSYKLKIYAMGRTPNLSVEVAN